MAADLVRLGGTTHADDCLSPDAECVLLSGLAEAGANISAEIEGMILTGVLLATAIFVGLGIWVGGVIGRRRGSRRLP